MEHLRDALQAQIFMELKEITHTEPLIIHLSVRFLRDSVAQRVLVTPAACHRLLCRPVCASPAVAALEPNIFTRFAADVPSAIACAVAASAVLRGSPARPGLRRKKMPHCNLFFSFLHFLLCPMNFHL
jgi:hypothetical protein